MLETIFAILIAAALIFIGIFIFKALLRIIVVIIILILLILVSNHFLGDDWLFKGKQEEIQETSSSQSIFI